MRNKNNKKGFAKPIPVIKTEEKKSFFSNLKFLIPVILLITFICYYPSLKNDFTNWDDPTYVLENPLVKDISKENLKIIFHPKTEVSLNYHPITIFSLAVNYHFSKLNAGPYIFTNLIFHLLNTLLVFFFIYILTGRKAIVAAITALLFGIHPMHVESVAWVSERKDVLYTFFFMAGLVTYLKYLNNQKIVFLLFTFLLFILSCLSKAMAVTLPVVLFLIDYYKGRKLNAKLILEKIPFFFIALLVGYNAVKIQSGGAINEFETFTIFQRFMFASNGFLMYLWKLFLPVNLSAFYPYPTLDSTGNIPLIFYISPIIVLMLFGGALLLYRKNKVHGRTAIFGLLFYSVTIALVLQFLSVGAAIMADRYSYIPYIGIFFSLALIASELINTKTKPVLITTLIAFAGICAYLTYERTQVWKNSETLWSDVIEKYPHRVETSYKNRGNYYADIKQVDKAYVDYMTLINMKTKDAKVYSNLGNIYGLKQQPERALEAYSKSLELEANNFDAYLNRAITYAMMKQHELALSDFEKAYALNPASDKLYMNRAYALLEAGKFEKSISDYSYLLTRYPSDPTYFFYRGLANFNAGNFSAAAEDFKNAINLKPDYADAYFNLSVTNFRLNKFKEALEYALKARSMNYNVPDSYLQQLQSKTE